MDVKKLIKSRVSLAPMAGITDYVLRTLARQYSKDCLLTTEMISSEALTQVKDTPVTKRDKNHSPISYQLSGHKPEMIAKCAKYLEQFADMIDINMGCPVGKIVRGNDGCALMRDYNLAYDIVKAVKDTVKLPVSVKFRLGFNPYEMNYMEFGVLMQEAGADFITIHARTRAQMYAGKADWAKIAGLKKSVDIPVFANGDINSYESAEKCLELSKADGIAIGRAALGDISLIYRIEHYLSTGEKLPEPSLKERLALLKKHLDLEIELRGEITGIKFMRKFYSYYINGIKNAAKYRSFLVRAENYGEIVNTLDFIANNE